MIENFYKPMDFKDLVPIALDIITNSINTYFTTKRLRNDILYKEYDINPIGRSRSNDDLNSLRKAISHQLIPILSNMRKLGYIEKETHKKWKKLKEIDLSPSEFIGKNNLRRRKKK